MPSAPTVFVDTNVLVYADDGREPAKRDQARAWLARIWAEPRGDARAEVRRYQHWNPWSTDHQTVETAWALEARFALSWWDALMVAAGLHQGCEMLLTEDLQHDQRIDNLRIVNPFRVGPELLDEPA